MKYYVYYHDDYPDNGGIGLQKFDTGKDALAFIAERTADKHASYPRTLNMYRLIEGTERALRVTETITGVATED